MKDMSKKPYKPIPKYRNKLSGLTASRLLLADNVEADHKRPGILTEKQYKALARSEGLASSRDVEVLNKWKHVYRITALTIREATIRGQEAIITLLKDCYYFSSLQYVGLLHGSPKCSKVKEIRKALSEVRHNITLVLAALTVLESVSDTIQVRLTEDLEALLERVVNVAGLYNTHIAGLHLEETEKEGLLLELVEVAASLEQLRYFEERIDYALGRGWRKAPFSRYMFAGGEQPDIQAWHDEIEVIAEEVYKL